MESQTGWYWRNLSNSPPRITIKVRKSFRGNFQPVPGTFNYLGSLSWSTPLQNSLISVKISRAGECLPSLSECKSSILDKTVSWLSNVYSGNPLKGGIFILRQIPIYWFSFFCSSDSACNSYRRSHLPRHIGHAGFVQQRIRWWPGWWFIQCSPPVGGVVRLCRGSGKHFGKIFFFIHYKHIDWGWDKMAAIFQMTFSNAFSWMKIYEFRLKVHRSS